MKRPLNLKPNILKQFDLEKPVSKEAFDLINTLNANLVKQLIIDCDILMEQQHLQLITENTVNTVLQYPKYRFLQFMLQSSKYEQKLKLMEDFK